MQTCASNLSAQLYGRRLRRMMTLHRHEWKFDINQYLKYILFSAKMIFVQTLNLLSKLSLVDTLCHIRT